MYWNHRVIKSAEDGSFNIHEVFYNDETDAIEGWTEGPTSPCGDESLEDLKADLEIYSKALEQDVLCEKELLAKVEEPVISFEPPTKGCFDHLPEVDNVTTDNSKG